MFLENVLGQSNGFMRRVICALVVVCLSPLASSLAVAADIPQNWISVRALGMGNAYTAVVEDGDALFYNPAALSRVEGINWTIFDLHAGLNGMETVTLIPQVIADIDTDPGGTMQRIYGKRLWAGGGGKSAIYMPYFGFAGYASTEAGFSAENQANPVLNTNYFFDYGIAVGSSIDLVPGIFSIGGTARRVNRTGTTMPLTASTLGSLDPAVLEAEFKRRGTGYGLDLGALIRLPGPVSPAISFVYRDVGFTSFNHEEGAGAPPRIEPEMLVGGSITIDAPFITITPAFDYRHMQRSDIAVGNKISLGVEIDLPLIDLRAGLNQGYYTAGVGLNLGLLRVDAATYGVELGAYPGQHEDRRYLVQLTFEVGFDPSKLNLGGGSGSGKPGERRRLKQRR